MEAGCRICRVQHSLAGSSCLQSGPALLLCMCVSVLLAIRHRLVTLRAAWVHRQGAVAA